jgi:glycosyltransferase involved in cell wall biosynthesis
MTPPTSTKVAIIIKALNEEEKIARSIESAIDATKSLGGEVILADSLSTDKTIEIARQYPIKIAQLNRPEDRCCGIGPQLGYQYSSSEYVYILDGDMQMLDNFLPEAIAFLDSNPEYAGVGGKVLEMNKESLEFQARVERAAEHMKSGDVDRLDMGGLYRTSAIKEAGYFSNKILHSYEELDLAVRLRSNGWKLYRIDIDAVRHWGHDSPPYQLLIKRWKSGYINGLGEIIKSAIGKPHFKLLINDVRELRIYLATIAWWLVMLATLFIDLSATSKTGLIFSILVFPILLMAIKKRSLKKAVFSVVSWNINALGLIRGFFFTGKRSEKDIDASFEDLTQK